MQTSIIDLTWELYEGMPGHPVHPSGPKFLSGTLSHKATAHWLPKTKKHGQVSFCNEQFVLHGHLGTHVDAPFHAAAGAPSIEAVPLEYTCGEAVWLDASARFGAGNVVTAEDLVRAQQAADVELAPIVLVHTGWCRIMEQDPKGYYKGAMGLSEGAVDWLKARGVRTVGIDSPTVDPLHSSDCPAHMGLLRLDEKGAYCCAIENLVGIDRIPRHRFKFVGVPLPLRGASGSPIRAIALVDEEC